MSWRRVHFADFLDGDRIDIQTGPFGTQLKASDYTSVGTPVINVRNIGYGELRPDKLEFVPDKIATRLSVHLLEKNDIVFGRKGAVDRHLLVGETETGWMQGSDCIRVRIKTDEINTTFLSYALLLPAHKQWMITQCSNKATMASLNHDVIGRIPLNLPNNSIQNEIASVLSAYDDLIKNNRRRIQLLEQAARLLYKEWFVHLRFPGHEHTQIIDGVPDGWEATFLPEVIDVNPKTPVEKGKEILYVPMSALSEAGMTADTADFERRTTHTAVKFKKNDVLLARITPCLENGKTGCAYFLGDDEVACGSTEFIVLRGRRVSHAFTYCLARSYPFRGNAIKSMIGSSGRQRVQVSCFDEYKVSLPPKHLLEMFDDIANTTFDQLRVLVAQNDKLTKSRDLLLPKLMNGEVAV